jgi:hypothetical protein
LKRSALLSRKIWVDDRDFQIVKTYGKAVPDINMAKTRIYFLDLRLTESK